jgi:hypothetical protein
LAATDDDTGARSAKFAWIPGGWMSSGGEADLLHYYHSFSKSNYLRLIDCFRFAVHVRPAASSPGGNDMLVNMYHTLQGN